MPGSPSSAPASLPARHPHGRVDLRPRAVRGLPAKPRSVAWRQRAEPARLAAARAGHRRHARHGHAALRRAAAGGGFEERYWSSSRNPGGLGIGLALSRRLAQMPDGTLDSRSEGPGTGSVFTVRLPLADAGLETVCEPCEPASLARTRVLVVDDNIDAADSLGLLLDSLGAEVRVAHDGAVKPADMDGLQRLLASIQDRDARPRAVPAASGAATPSPNPSAPTRSTRRRTSR